MTTTFISRYQGDDWTLPFTYKDNLGNPINLTGCSITINIYSTNGAMLPLSSMSNSFTSTITSNGNFSILIPKTTTAKIQSSTAAYAKIQVILINSIGLSTTLGVVLVKVVPI
jgi:hypothetical protein